ncbi:response regulator [Candidatus Harpocratesius sp.]
MTDKKGKASNINSLTHEQGKILIIDDEIALRKSLKKMLERAGFYCETAFDYSSAQEAVENLNFDLILVDIILPEMNGLSLIAKLQDKMEISSAIIFVTGEPNLETAMQAIKLGAYDYLEKPTQRTVLIESIKRALLRRGYKLKIAGKEIQKTINLSSTFIKTEKYQMNEELKEEFQRNVSTIHNALLELKKRYGEELSTDQRLLLNQIAQSNGKLKKTLKKIT